VDKVPTDYGDLAGYKRRSSVFLFDPTIIVDYHEDVIKMC